MQLKTTPASDFFETARREWPTHFGITALRKLAPDIIATDTVHNAISAGVGPLHRKRKAGSSWSATAFCRGQTQPP